MTQEAVEVTMGAPVELKQGLKQRHLTMIAMGGVIGAGLFIGSGVVIGDAGPAAVIAYAVTGAVIILIMRMLGEMAVANPSTGSFADYARNALGGWAGFAVGWLYWYYWVVVVGFEAIAGATIIQLWIDVPLWVLAFFLMVTMTATNLLSVSSFGEFEFWFAGIKVVAIVVFIALATTFVIGLWPGHSADLSNLTDHGGFMPNGVGSIFSSVVVVIFAMAGAEIATIAAAESPDPGKAIARATRSIVVRLTVFFVVSVFLLTVVLPWNDQKLGASPFAAAFEEMGIPFAPTIMDAVVLTGVLSVLNSGLYTASRMLFVLAARREAPLTLMTVGPSGVPRRAILMSSVVGFLCVIAAAASPDKVFYFLINSIGPIILLIYVIIAISQIVLRRRTAPEQLVVKMWLFPFLSIFAIVAMLAVLVQMALAPDLRIQCLLSLVALGVVVVVYFVAQRFANSPFSVSPEPAPAGMASRVLVLANETVEARELLEELHNIDRAGRATYWVCVPANPIDLGQAEHAGAVYLWDRTEAAAQERLARTLEALRTGGLDADGALGDYRPLRALSEAVDSFHPDRLVISTLRQADSAWLRYDVVDRAREAYPNTPLTHIVAGREDEATHV
jgi:GABA permease